VALRERHLAKGTGASVQRNELEKAFGYGVYLSVTDPKGGILISASRYFLNKASFIILLGLTSILHGQVGAANPDSQQAAASDQKIPAVKVTTRLVVVDVVAHDKKGRAVTDLELPDLRILEDGKEQVIRSFVLQQPGASAVESVQEQAALPANMVSNARKFPPNTALNVILLDSLNSTFLNQAYVRIEMVKFLEKLPQGQPVAVFTLGRRLHMVQDFTTDLTQLKAVVNAFKGESSAFLQNPTGTTEMSMVPQGFAAQALTDPIGGDPALLYQMKEFAEQTTADQSDMRVQYTFSALLSLGRILSRYPGRKNLIWVSESIPMNVFATVTSKVGIQPGSDQVQDVYTGHISDRTHGDQLAYLANLLTDAQVSVYPVDARGLVGSALYNVANGITGQGVMGGLGMQGEGKQAEALFQAHASMLDIAEKTGGKAYYNRNDIDNALGDGIRDGSTYYILGYYPESKKWDGKFRKIQVKTRRKGIDLRYRTGYFAVDREADMAQHPERKDVDYNLALSMQSPIYSALLFKAEVNPPAADSTTVVLRYAINPESIQFIPDAEGLQRAQVDCAVRAFSSDDMDNPVKTEGTKVNAALKPDAFTKVKSKFFPCELKVDLPPGHYFLRLAVRDSNSGSVGSVNAQVTVPGLPMAARRNKKHAH
jgi:VWFA-related protein